MNNSKLKDRLFTYLGFFVIRPICSWFLKNQVQMDRAYDKENLIYSRSSSPNRVSSPQDLYTMNMPTTSWKEREMEKKSFSRPTHDHNFLTCHKQNKVSMCFRVGTIVEFHAVFFCITYHFHFCCFLFNNIFVWLLLWKWKSPHCVNF